MTVEHNEKVLLKYQNLIPLYARFLLREGEFFRETATVNIIDNDGKNVASVYLLCYGRPENYGVCMSVFLQWL